MVGFFRKKKQLKDTSIRIQRIFNLVNSDNNETRQTIEIHFSVKTPLVVPELFLSQFVPFTPQKTLLKVKAGQFFGNMKLFLDSFELYDFL